MQQLDAYSLALWVKEQAPLLTGAMVSKIHHVSAFEWRMHLWGKHLPSSAQLYINLSPPLPVLVIAPNAESLLPVCYPQFEQPTGLCLLLRKHLLNTRITRVFAVPDERVVCMTLMGHNALGQPTAYGLVVELMGNRSNMVLLTVPTAGVEAAWLADPSITVPTGVILGVAKSVSERQSQFREMLPKLPYQLPPQPWTSHREGFCAADFTTADAKQRWQDRLGDVLVPLLQDAHQGHPVVEKMALATALSEHLTGVGPAMLAAMLTASERDRSLEHADAANWAFQQLVKYQQAVFPNTPVPTGLLQEDGFAWDLGTGMTGQAFGINDTLWQYAQQVWSQVRVETLRQALVQQVGRVQAKVQERHEQLAKVTGHPPGYWQACGAQLLQAYHANELGAHPAQWTAATGQTVWTMPAWEDDTLLLSVPIVPEWDWQRHIDHCFNQAKKAKGRLVHQARQTEGVMRARDTVAHVHWMLSQAKTREEVMVVAADWAELMPQVSRWAAGEGLTPEDQPKHLPRSSKKTLKPKKPTTSKPIANKPAILSGVMQLTNAQGWGLWVGKHGRANAALSGTLAQDTDIWCHVQHGPGAHVLLKAPPVDAFFAEVDRSLAHDTYPDWADWPAWFKTIPITTLEDAGMLAIAHSPAQASANVPVVFTQARYVKKIPGSYPGHVTYRNEVALFLSVDTARLAELQGA